MFWVKLFEILLMVIIPAITYALKFLGIFAVSYIGINFALGKLLSILQSHMASTPILVQSLAGLMKFDVAVNIYLSALTAKLVLAGLNKVTDKQKKFVFKA